MSQQARSWDQNPDNHDQEQGSCPSGDFVIHDLKMRILTVSLDRFVGEKEEHPDAGAYDRGVHVEDEAFDDGVDSARQEAKGTCKENECDDSPVLRLKPF